MVLQVGHPRPRRANVRGMPPTGELGGYYVAEGLAGKTYQGTFTHANKPAAGNLVPAENIPVSHVAGAWVEAIGIVKSVVTKVLFYSVGPAVPGAQPSASPADFTFRWGDLSTIYQSPVIVGDVVGTQGTYADMTITATPQVNFTISQSKSPASGGNVTEWNNIQFFGAFQGGGWMDAVNDPASYLQYSLNLQIAYMIYLRQAITWR